jgi:hypothetical protein
MSQRIRDITIKDGYVRRPDSGYNTNSLRRADLKENAIGTAACVDTLEETERGVRVTTVKDNVRFTSLYPWHMIQDVRYDPEPVTPPAVAKKA